MSIPHTASPTRLRRLRRTPQLRSLVRETSLAASDLILPIFVLDQDSGQRREPIESLYGHARLSIELTVELCKQAHAAGIGGVLLFGLPSDKDEHGSSAWASDGVVQRAVRAIKAAIPELLVITDVCLCHYTSHGHCGPLDTHGAVLNDQTVEYLTRVAASHAAAGADIVAPSDMMDHRVSAIRARLDADGFSDRAIMSYSTKFASAYYGPFREAADSAPETGDRSGYQMDPANGDEAVRESVLDLAEGADILMVKPALSYLDVVRRIKTETRAPLAVYNVSGEYTMVKAAAAQGFIDERRVQLETLLSMRRAGADIIITYAALEAAAWLRDTGGAHPQPRTV